MITSKKKSLLCSRAGQLGADLRWHGHIKVQTTLIRVQKNDADHLSRLASASRSTVGSIVHSLLEYSSYNIRASKSS